MQKVGESFVEKGREKLNLIIENKSTKRQQQSINLNYLLFARTVFGIAEKKLYYKYWTESLHNLQNILVMSYKKSLLLLWVFIETRNWTVINWLIAGGREANWVVMGGTFYWLIYRGKWLRDNGRDVRNIYWNPSGIFQNFLKAFLFTEFSQIIPQKLSS